MRNDTPAMMKSIRLHAPAGPEALVYEEVARPTPAADEVLVRVHAAALTRDELDWPVDRLPAIPSYELSGTVVSVGDQADGFEPGRAVLALTDFERDGVAAEYAAVPHRHLGDKPQPLSHVESAAIPLPGLSAMQGLFTHGRLEKNQRVLIHGGAGGVGAFAVQLARLHGAYVIATASGERVALARDLGADSVIAHTEEDFTAIEPVDLVFDTAGGERLSRSVEVLRTGGRLVSVAEEPPEDLCRDNGVEGVFFVVEPNRDQLGELTRLADLGRLQVVIDRTYQLADGRAAFERTLSGGGRGKVVLTVTGGEGGES